MRVEGFQKSSSSLCLIRFCSMCLLVQWVGNDNFSRCPPFSKLIIILVDRSPSITIFALINHNLSLIASFHWQHLHAEIKQSYKSMDLIQDKENKQLEHVLDGPGALCYAILSFYRWLFVTCLLFRWHISGLVIGMMSFDTSILHHYFVS
jgi:hypothetical protein